MHFTVLRVNAVKSICLFLFLGFKSRFLFQRPCSCQLASFESAFSLIATSPYPIKSYLHNIIYSLSYCRCFSSQKLNTRVDIAVNVNTKIYLETWTVLC